MTLDIVSYDEALSYDWPRVAAGIYPWDAEFDPALALALRLLNRGRIEDFIVSLEPLPFEEWERLLTRHPAHMRPLGIRGLRSIAECHPDDGWRYNALRILDESSAALPVVWLESLLEREDDAENREQIELLIAERSGRIVSP